MEEEFCYNVKVSNRQKNFMKREKNKKVARIQKGVVSDSKPQRCVFVATYKKQPNQWGWICSGDGPGAVRRFVDMVDQFTMTRDFYDLNNTDAFLRISPKEFDLCNPARI